MDPTPLLPYLAGLIPVCLARTWQARSVAIVFGLVSIGLGMHYIECIHRGQPVLATVQSVKPVVIGALGNVVLAVVATYLVDKKYGRKSVK
ncbi:MAG TPA: hypothetical protein VH619_11220 [Verrucomicrobiae bacterium]|jgi:hypothetical protein|nr:hypothetical protein [Verrucomicrobiae bacterium]